MHILEVYLESGGYDYNLIKGGISVYLWNLSKAFVDKGHQVSMITAMHGQQDYLREHYELVELDYHRNWTLDLTLDPEIWGQNSVIDVPLQTKAYRLHKDGIDIYLLSNEYLDKYPDTFYPPYSSKGKDIGFYKSLIFQMEVIFFIRDYFANPEILVHAHEPYYQYLLPCALATDGYRVVSTVQSNMPINKKVYKPKIASLLTQLNVMVDLDQFDDVLPNNDFNRCLLEYLPLTHLHYDYPENYINLYALVLAYSYKIDFLSEGHLEFYKSFKGTAFRALYNQLQIKKWVNEKSDHLFVGGCGLSNSWLTKNFSSLKANKDQTLKKLGLTPGLPGFYHNARYAPNHKGQVELVLAIERVLASGLQANFILRCVSGNGIADTRFHELQAKYPSNVALIWQYQAEDQLMAMAAAADFSLFPSKFEMDTFLIAQGESMLAGCVPIASSQLGMKHWNHCDKLTADETARTGFSVVRSFLEEDPQLVDDLFKKISESANLYVGEPDQYQILSKKAMSHAHQFTWGKVADSHLNNFESIQHSMKSNDFFYDDIFHKHVHENGELVSVRMKDTSEEFQAKLPVLIADKEIRYSHPQVKSIDLFIIGKDVITRKAMSLSGNEFHFKPENDQKNCLLLVTLKNGIQYWDGVLAASLH